MEDFWIYMEDQINTIKCQHLSDELVKGFHESVFVENYD